MKKLILILIAFIGCICSMKAQVLFYIPAGADVNNTEVFVFYHSNGQLSIVDYTTSYYVERKLMEDPNFFENRGRKFINQETVPEYTGKMTYVRNSNGYNIYAKKWMIGSPPYQSSALRLTDYYGFSPDFKTMVFRPDIEGGVYYTRVDKSNFEIRF